MARRSPDAGGRIHLQIVNRTRSPLAARGSLEAAARLALAPLAGKAGGREISTALVCVGGARMKKLNAEFTGRAELTDVLAFPMGEVDPEEDRFLVGEVVVCRPVAEREARSRGLPVRNELLLYALHGWLHLAGHRDGTERGRARMLRAERRIMGALGLKRDG